MLTVSEINALTGEVIERDFTPDETAQRQQDAQEAAAHAAAIAALDANRDTIQEQATTALAANRTYLAIATPTNAQVAAQVKALTRQNQGIIRLTLGLLDAVD